MVYHCGWASVDLETWTHMGHLRLLLWERGFGKLLHDLSVIEKCILPIFYSILVVAALSKIENLIRHTHSLQHFLSSSNRAFTLEPTFLPLSPTLHLLLSWHHCSWLLILHKMSGCFFSVFFQQIENYVIKDNVFLVFTYVFAEYSQMRLNSDDSLQANTAEYG